MAGGRSRRKAERQLLVKSPQKKTAPPERMMAAGPLARTARPRKKPNRMRASQGVRGRIGVFWLRGRPKKTAAEAKGIVRKGVERLVVAGGREKTVISAR